MAINYQILGQPGRDNALLVRVDSGQNISRLMFDCGDGCLDALSISEIQSIDTLFFSHFHMDHVAGFDSFFRCNFGRDNRRNEVFGPAGTRLILHHRFQGFWWNLHQDLQAIWQVHDVTPEEVLAAEFRANDAFQSRHDIASQSHDGSIVAHEDYTVRAIQLEHNGPSIGYRIDETTRTNIDTTRLKELGLKPGPWLRDLKEGRSGEIEIDGQPREIDSLREELLTQSAGESIAYITDFLLDESAHERLTTFLRGCDTVVCEAQYRDDDSELAAKNFHATTRRVGRLAAAAEIGELKLFHLSDRYTKDEWLEMLDECLSEFPSTRFSNEWSDLLIG